MAISEEDTRPFSEQLRRALDEPGAPSIRALAKLLAGEEATDRQVEGRRSQIRKWLHGDNVPREEAVRRVEQALAKPEGFFVIPRRRRASAVELGELRADLTSSLQRLEDGVIATLDRIASAGEALADSLDQLRPLLEAQKETVAELRSLLGEQQATVADLRAVARELARREASTQPGQGGR